MVEKIENIKFFKKSLKKKPFDYFTKNEIKVDYRNLDDLKRFTSSNGKILPLRRTGLTALNQRRLARAIKRARMISLLPFFNKK